MNGDSFYINAHKTHVAMSQKSSVTQIANFAL
jgi:hypothetical protein